MTKKGEKGRSRRDEKESGRRRGERSQKGKVSSRGKERKGELRRRRKNKKNKKNSEKKWREIGQTRRECARRTTRRMRKEDNEENAQGGQRGECARRTTRKEMWGGERIEGRGDDVEIANRPAHFPPDRDRSEKKGKETRQSEGTSRHKKPTNLRGWDERRFPSIGTCTEPACTSWREKAASTQRMMMERKERKRKRWGRESERTLACCCKGSWDERERKAETRRENISRKWHCMDPSCTPRREEAASILNILIKMMEKEGTKR